MSGDHSGEAFSEDQGPNVKGAEAQATFAGESSETLAPNDLEDMHRAVMERKKYLVKQ